MSSPRPYRRRLSERFPGEVAVIAFGLCLTGLSAWNFLAELQELTSLAGPVLALVANVGLSLAVVGIGVWLARSPLPGHRRWTVAGWCLLGALVAFTATGFTFAVRALEGRSVAEPQFSLIVMSSIGAIFGALVGRKTERAREEAARARETKDAMAFTNSLLRHDVLNGLQIMRGHAELVADADDEEIVESGEALAGQVTAIEELIREVRAVSETLLGEADTEPIDLSPILEAAVETTVDADPTATFETDIASPLVVNGTLALKPVFTNLLNNAIQHTDSGAHVRVTGENGGETVVVTIEDDGPGVPPSERDRIFGRGVTTDGGDGGLGLHIVSTLVERSGGSVSVADSDLGGAAFVVELPKADADPRNENEGPFG